MISLDCTAIKKTPCLIGGRSCNFQPSFRGGSVMTPEKNSGEFSHGASVELLLFTFHSFSFLIRTLLVSSTLRTLVV